MNCQRTTIAFWTAGSADLPTEPYDPVAEIAAFLRGQDLTQLAFYFFRLFAFGKTQPAADPDAMGIADHASRHTVKIA